MRRILQLAVGLSAALALAACGSTVQYSGRQAVSTSGGLDATATTGQGLAPSVSGSTSAATDGQAPGAQPGTTGSSSGGSLPPVTGPQPSTPGRGSTKPLQIGVLVTDTDSFQKAAGGTSYTVVTRDAIHAYIKAINAAGGVAGRQLSVVDATFNYSAASYDTEFEAACQKFTQDNHVGAVIYDGVTYNNVFYTCLTKARVPVFVMQQVGTQIGDSTDMAAYPGLITAGSVNIDRRLKTVMTQSLAHGFLRAGSKIGVLVEDCPYATRSYDRTLLPLANRNKITLSRVDINCGQGSADHATGINAIGSAVLRFQTENDDSIMFVTNYENGSIFYFAAAAEAQRYRPQYLLWHNQGSPAYLDYFKSKGLGAQLKKMKGFGSSPQYEVTYPPAPPPAQAAVQKSCLATAKRQQIAVPDEIARGVVLDSCDVVNLFVRALTLSGGQGGVQPLVAAVNRFGTDFVSTMVLNGATRFGSGRHDGPALGETSAYQDKCGCMVYISPPRPIA